MEQMPSVKDLNTDKSKTTFGFGKKLMDVILLKGPQAIDTDSKIKNKGEYLVPKQHT